MFNLFIIAALLSLSSAFSPIRPIRRSTTTSLHVSIPNEPVQLDSPLDVSPDLLRSLNVINVNGEQVKLGTVMGQEKSVVIFLRHLGCPWCWSYANWWCDHIPQLKEAGVKGPIFISIGYPDKLEAFLEANPKIPRDQIFVDQPTYDAYNTMGIKMLFADKELTMKGGRRFKMPDLSWEQWKAYFTVVGKLEVYIHLSIRLHSINMLISYHLSILYCSYIIYTLSHYIYYIIRMYTGKLAPTKDTLYDIGGRLGASYAVKGDGIVYFYEEGVPGDHPDPANVIHMLTHD